MMASSSSSRISSLLVNFVFMVFLHVVAGTDGCIENERRALLALKTDIYQPPQWLSSWRAINGGDCCIWQGVGCHNITGHVTKLDLRYPFDSSFVLGPSKLSSSLLDLKHLKYLDLSLNNFSGSHIPEFIGSLPNLEYLNLSHANFGGVVPPQIGNLSRLYSLDLKYCFGLNGGNNLHWISQISSLRYLDMSFVDLSMVSDHWIDDLNRLPSLSVLILSEANLNSIPATLYHVNFTSLQWLDLSYNNFAAEPTVMPNWILNISSLVHLDLDRCRITNMKFLEMLIESSNNKISGELPEAIGSIKQLQYLDLSFNMINGQLPQTLYKLSNLQVLRLRGNNISGPIPESLGKLSNLQWLGLRDNNISGLIPESLGQLSRLVRLNLSNNSFTGKLTDAHFATLTDLDYLYLSYNNHLELIPSQNWIPPFNASSIMLCSCGLGPKFAAWLKNQTNLQNLCLSDAGISDIIPTWFSDFKNIWYLNLSHNAIGGQLSLSVRVQELFSLSIIDLSYNSFDGYFPLHFASRSLITYLSLSHNQFSGSVPSYLCNLTSLEVLVLSNNKFSGSVPLCQNDYQGIEILDLSNNNFSGHIPDLMNFYPSLQSLHLRNNSLSGEIPPSLKHCKQLAVLDLGNNRLSGNIPKWIGRSLSELRVLSLR